MSGSQQLAILADEHVAALAKITLAAKTAGLDDESIGKLVAEYAKIVPKEDRKVICGNVDKGTRLACTRSPHPDKPGQREEHAAQNRQGAVITWRGQPSLGEQLAEEKADSGAKCGAKATVQYGEAAICVRLRHGPDRPHAGTHTRIGLMTW